MPVDELPRLLGRLPVALALLCAAEIGVLRDLPVAPPALLLACGDGQLGLALARHRVPHAAGLEPDRAAARLAAATGAFDRVVVGDPADLPFPCHAFRTVLAPGAFATAPDPVRLAAECARVLRPGGGDGPQGLLAATLPFAGAGIVKRRLYQAGLAASGTPRPLHAVTAVEAALAAAGFRITRRIGFGARRAGWLAALLSLNLTKGFVYRRTLGRYLPFPALTRRFVAPVALALAGPAGGPADAGDHLLILARLP